MTDTLDDRALRLAFNTAAHASVMLGDETSLDPLNMAWPSFGAVNDPVPQAEYLAAFVRANREAPPEALYIHARPRIHTIRTPWAVLPLPDAFAYALFVLVLNQTDAKLAQEKAARDERERAAGPQPAARRPSRDDHVMERHDGMLEREIYTDPRLSKKRGRTMTLPVKRGQ